MTELDALLEAIYASPDDDAPRLVYADALLERGDPRGEFIVRQCRGDAASDLILQHGHAWLGDLAPLLIQSGFERGFLATATARELWGRDLARVVGHPLWRTVREFRGPAAIALHSSMTALRVLHVASEVDHWRELLAGTPRELTELHYTLEESWDPGNDHTATPMSGGIWTTRITPDELAMLGECAALPKLRRLVLTNVPDASLPAVSFGSVLERVVLETQHDPISIKIAKGIAEFTVAARSDAYAVLAMIRRLPARLRIGLATGPQFEGLDLLESALGDRLLR